MLSYVALFGAFSFPFAKVWAHLNTHEPLLVHISDRMHWAPLMLPLGTYVSWEVGVFMNLGFGRM